MPRESGEVYEGRDLAKKVRNINTLGAYLDFHDNHFSTKGSGDYREAVKRVCESTDNGPDFFRLLGFIGVQGIQYGFPTLTRQLHRHRQKGWTGSPFDPGHLLALTVYLGKINSQAHIIKQGLAEKLAIVDPEAALGVWNIKLPVFKTQVSNRTASQDLESIREEASFRLSKNIPIFMPDLEINQRLAQIDFSGDDAESMRPEVFQSTVLPKASPVLRWFMNPDLAFQNFKESFFSIPKVELASLA
jgi:hypothetical protein